MSFLIGLLTVILVLNCVLLILLVLIQLPKKDAGAGLAFGGGASDALFGAGAGNVLTKITKYGTVTFFLLAMVLSVLQSHYYHRNSTEFKRAFDQQNAQSPGQPLQPLDAPAMLPAGSNSLETPVTAPAAPPSTPAPSTN